MKRNSYQMVVSYVTLLHYNRPLTFLTFFRPIIKVIKKFGFYGDTGASQKTGPHGGFLFW
ncbi:MAG: hypothetical protein ACYSTS_15900 [Planctomycetota bacterium]